MIRRKLRIKAPQPTSGQAAVTREEHPANTQRTTNNEPTSSSSGRERGFPYLPIVDQYEILDSFAPLSLSTFIALKYVK